MRVSGTSHWRLMIGCRCRLPIMNAIDECLTLTVGQGRIPGRCSADNTNTTVRFLQLADALDHTQPRATDGRRLVGWDLSGTNQS